MSLIGRAGQARPKRLTRTVDLSRPARHVIRLSVAGRTRNHVFVFQRIDPMILRLSYVS